MDDIAVVVDEFEHWQNGGFEFLGEGLNVRVAKRNVRSVQMVVVVVRFLNILLIFEFSLECVPLSSFTSFWKMSFFIFWFLFSYFFNLSPDAQPPCRQISRSLRSLFPFLWPRRRISGIFYFKTSIFFWKNLDFGRQTFALTTPARGEVDHDYLKF